MINRYLEDGGPTVRQRPLYALQRCPGREGHLRARRRTLQGRYRQPLFLLCIAALVWTLGAGPAWADDSGRPPRKATRPQPPRNEALRQTLLKMAQEDQAEAVLAMKGPVPNAAEHARARVALLKQIVAEYGWPGISLVGPDGADAAWLIAQHADFDVPFQRQCLTLVEQAYSKGEVTGMQLAYLTDRVLIAEHKPQLYGTQGAPIYSAEEKAQVEARRRKLGLPSMAEMAREKSKLYQRLYEKAEQAPAR